MEEYVVDIEFYTAGLRVFVPGGKYGDPYIFNCTVRWINKKLVELTLVSAKPDMRMRKPVKAALRNLGVEEFMIIHNDRQRIYKTSS